MILQRIIAISLFTICGCIAPATAQTYQVSGTIIDGSNGLPLMRALLSADSGKDSMTDQQGVFFLWLRQGVHHIRIHRQGFSDTSFHINVSCDLVLQPITLSAREQLLNEVVIGTGRYGRSIMEQIGSVNTIHSREFQAKNITDAAQAIEQLPGVVVIDGQATVRGGSGYAYGAGSRLMLVVDGVPLLTSDRNDVKWSFVPMENVERIELVKGASSVQFGSSALNGVMNVETAFPKKDKESIVSTYISRYDGSIPAYRRKAEDKTPFASGIYALHRRRVGRHDFVFDVYGQRSQSWLQGDFAKMLRPHFKYRYRLSDRLTMGVNANGLLQHSSRFFLWMNDSTEAYQPLNGPTTLVNLKELYVSIQPYIHYTDRSGFRHSAHVQYYRTNHINPASWVPATNLFSADYFVQKDVRTWKLSGGGMANAFYYRDDGIGGKKSGNSGALFVQFEKKFRQLRMEGGGRYEVFRLDTIVAASRPVGRFGINYTPNRRMAFRGSFAQGFRFPSPAERLVRYNLGDIYVYPNETLLPEFGWNTELGLRRKMELGSCSAYADGALFLQGFRNMMEFVIGQWGDPSAPMFGVGFKSVNVNTARIAGAEFEAGIRNTGGKFRLSSDIGYTYTYPVDLNEDPSLRDVGRFLRGFSRGFSTPDSAFSAGLLRYRNRHLLKFDLDASRKKYSFGTSIRHYSRMDKIDLYFNLFSPGIRRYRELHTRGDWVMDLRCSVQTREYGRFSLICTNVWNAFYTIRIGKPDAPRCFTLQYLYQW